MVVPDQTSGTNTFLRRLVTPQCMGAALNPIHISLIATALVPIT
jgi:hypothetical protein